LKTGVFAVYGNKKYRAGLAENFTTSLYSDDESDMANGFQVSRKEGKHFVHKKCCRK
jgi:hypothetical protein